VTVNLSADEQSELLDHCKELVRKAGGTIREDMSRFFGYIGYGCVLSFSYVSGWTS
jgi:hypothetical protein